MYYLETRSPTVFRVECALLFYVAVCDGWPLEVSTLYAFVLSFVHN